MKLVALFTCASLDIGGWCTVKHRYLGYHVACPPWSLYWSKGVLCSALTEFFVTVGWVGVSWSKIRNFVMFQCLASACVQIRGDPGDWFLWSPWSVLPAVFSFDLNSS